MNLVQNIDAMEIKQLYNLREHHTANADLVLFPTDFQLFIVLDRTLKPIMIEIPGEVGP